MSFPLGLILGYQSLREFRERHLQQEQPPQGRGLALAAVWIAYSGLALGIVVFLVRTIPPAVS